MEQDPSEDDVWQAEIDGITRFMEEKNVAVDCYACKEETPGWQVYPTLPQAPSLPIGKGGDFLIGGSAIETIAMRCANCGYIRLFDRGVYSQWRQENEPV